MPPWTVVTTSRRCSRIPPLILFLTSAPSLLDMHILFPAFGNNYFKVIELSHWIYFIQEDSCKGKTCIHSTSLAEETIICEKLSYSKTIKFMKINSHKLTASLIQLTFTFQQSFYLLLSLVRKKKLKYVKWEKEKLIGNCVMVSLPDCLTEITVVSLC